MEKSNFYTALKQQDAKYHLHSQTCPTDVIKSGATIITHGKGACVFDETGKSYLEAAAGLWNTTLGFSNERLIKAAHEQYREFGFYHTFFNKTVPSIAELSEKLVAITGIEGGKAYFAGSGSEANESMVKLAWLYHAQCGNPKKRKIIAREKAFHGSTIFAASMSGLPFMHREFGLPLSGVLHTECPDTYRGIKADEDIDSFVDRLVAELEQMIIREDPSTIAAFIAEPIYAAGGLFVPPKRYFPEIKKVLTKYNILLLDDEIVCGFGRTGRWFGKDTVGMEPDMMSLAKGLSSGYFPISAVIIKPEIYEAVSSMNSDGTNFGHGFTNSGHPVGAAVANEAIRIYEEMDVCAHVSAMGALMRERLEEIGRSSSIVGDIRGAGLMLAVELVEHQETRTSYDPSMKIGGRFDKLTFKNGLITRCMRDIVGFSPPYIITDSQANQMIDIFELSLREIEKELGR